MREGGGGREIGSEEERGERYGGRGEGEGEEGGGREDPGCDNIWSIAIMLSHNIHMKLSG